MNRTSLQTGLNYQLILNVLLLLLGIVLLIFPANGLAFITWIVGIAFLGAAIVCGAIVVLNRKNLNIPLLAAAGGGFILGILIVAFRIPISQVAVPIAIAVWVVASAVICIMAAFSYRKVGAALWWLPLVAALVAIVIAFLILTNLASTAKLLAYFIAIYFIVFSGIRIGEYFTLRKYR